MREQEVRELYEAYLQVHQPQEEVEELDEAGLPYGPVGKEFKKLPAGKKRAAMMKRAGELRTQAMKDDGDGGKGSPRGKMGEINSALTNPRLREGVDLFDTILEHLVAEGYADTNEAALAIMANMSEEWRESIVDEGYKEIDREKHGRMYNRYKKLRTAAMKDAQETGEASGDNRYKMGKMSKVIDKSAENLRNKG